MNPIASFGICNTASLNIYGFEYGVEDYVVAGMNNDRPRRYKVHYTNKGAYFNWAGCRYYVSEFVKI